MAKSALWDIGTLCALFPCLTTGARVAVPSQVGFHNNKVKYIKEATRIVAEKHAGRVPSSFDELLELPG